MRKSRLYNVLLYPNLLKNMDLYKKRIYYSSPVITYKLSLEDLAELLK